MLGRSATTPNNPSQVPVSLLVEGCNAAEVTFGRDLQWTETPRVSATVAQQRSLAETENRRSQFAEIELQPLEAIALNTSLRNAKLREIITLSGFHTNEAFLNNRDFLRDATNDVHQSLDSRMGEVGIFDTAENYRGFLQCMAAMHREFGAAVEAVANLAGLPPRANVLTECFINDLDSTCSPSDSNTDADWKTLCMPSVRDAHCGITAFDWGLAGVGGDAFVQNRIDEDSNDIYAESLAMMELKLPTKILGQTSVNQSKAAELLGITRSRLRTKIRSLGIMIDQIDPAE